MARKPFTAAEKRRHSETMRKMWAAKRQGRPPASRKKPKVSEQKLMKAIQTLIRAMQP